MSKFGSFLRAKRKAASLSQAGLADRCGGMRGVNQFSVSQWERGLAQPNPAQLEAIARALDFADADRLRALELAALEYPQAETRSAS